MVNNVCVNLGSELLFIDTGTNPKDANKFRNEMQKIFSPEKVILTFTHANNDHFMGVEAFLDCSIIATDKFMTPYKKRIKSQKRESLKNFKPTETYSLSRIFGSEENSLIFTITGGHTEDSCFGYFPTEKILIAGDNLLTDMPQYFFHFDSNLMKYIHCLKTWKNMDIKTVIPGHGNPVDHSYISKVLVYFERLHDFLINGKESNLLIQEILNHPKKPDYFEPDPNDWLSKGIKQVYNKL
ncbi:MAG: MBL fold metallo-hydrolase [Candidatus Hodarchaeales archaeon]